MLRANSQGAAFPFDDLSRSWLGAVAIAVAIGIAYFMAARFGLAFRSKPGGVAVFWPAAGIAIGALIALGPNARLPVAVAVAVATIISKLLITGNLWLGITFGIVCAGQTLLTAWLTERWFGGAFKLENVTQVLGFLVASTAGAVVAALGAVAAISLAHSTASALDVWRPWFAACLLGTVTVAPMLIGLAAAVRELPPRRELIEGASGLVALGALSVFIISLPKGYWATALPVALVFPLLLWVAVRCRPVFAATAAFIVGLAIIWSTTFNLGHFGDESIPLADRILTAQTFVLAGALLTVILAALFADRGRSEAALKQSKERLQQALDGAELGAFSADIASGRLECDARAAQMHGHNVPPITIKQWRQFVHPRDLVHIDAALAETRRTGSVWNAEYRVMHPPDHPHAGETGWVAVEGSTLFDIHGTPVGLFGVTRDITQRKQAEQALTERNIQLALAAKAGLVGSYAYDTDTEIMRISAGYAAIHGFPEGTVEIARSECLASVHPEDIGRVGLVRKEAFRKREREYSVEYRIIRAGEFRWVETRCFISYQSDGHPTQVVGVSIDITERKRAEQTLAERDAQLELAQKAARVGCYTYDAIAGTIRFSRDSAVTYGLSQNTMELTTQKWLARVHRDDVQRMRAEHIRAFKKRQHDLVEEFRIVRAGGEVRWIEARSLISYNHAGRAERMTGVFIDVTERRKAEDQKSLLIAELDHRVKNVLACVAAVAQRTRECSRSPDEFLEELNGRINSLANTHALLSRSQWQGVGVSKLVRSELAFCANGRDVLIEGPEVELAAEAVQPVAMVLHELVTNAAKYGALSDGRGRIAIRWRRQSNGGSGGKLVLEWRETGGPPVAAPNATGYGTTVIRELIPFELGGAVDYELAREGARCRLVIPAKWLTNSRRVGVTRHAHSDRLSPLRTFTRASDVIRAAEK